MKHKKIYIMILTGLYIFFLSIFNVKADVYSCLVGSNSETPRSIELATTSPARTSYTKSCDSFNNKGNGYIYFIVKATPKVQNVPINRFLNMIEISTSTNWVYQCEYGTFNGYIDNQNSSTLYSVKCPVSNFDGSGGSGTFNKITLGDSGYFTNNGNQGLYLDIGPYIMFVTESESDIIGALNSNTQLIISAMNGNNQTAQDIKNAIEEDVNNSYKQTPNQTDYNNYHNQEQSILGQISNTDTSAINIQNNNNANLFIWDTITRSLQSHAKVMALMISILSIGIIKLILNR